MRTLLLTTALTLSLGASPVFAQNNDEEIVVTATRAPAAVENLPAQVYVIDADVARERGRITIDEALADTPGIQVTRAGPAGQQTSIFSGGFESNHTLVLFDGTRIDDPSTPEGIFDAGQDTLGDASRIEIVQGPMSALYGSAALGGVVNILPRRGGEGALNPRMELASGSFNTVTANVGADGALGRFRYAVNGEGYSSDGYDVVPQRMTTHAGEEDGADITTVTGVFDFDLTDTLALDLLVRQRDAEVETDYDPFGNVGEVLTSRINSETDLWRLGGSWSPNEALSLRVRGGALVTDRYNVDGFGAVDEYHGDRKFADIDAAWSMSNWTLLAGVQAEREEAAAISFTTVSGEQEHWGVYGAAHGSLGAVDLTAAVRHDDFDGFGGETTWRAGASYRLIETARVYAAYGASYRAPSLYERFVPGFGNTALDPESATSWEVGADARFGWFGQDNGLELGALYRSSEIEDLIGFGATYINIDRADIEYAEARIALRPTNWLTARVTYANTDARNAVTDAQLQRRPENAWSAELAAAHGAFSGSLSWRQVGERQDVRYDDFGFWAGSGAVDAYEVVRASAAWTATDSVRLFVAADNVLDETYEPVNGSAGAPASVLIGVRVRP
jgi:vitamin B12 transporter